jgi:hypothetical protein
MRGQWRAAVTKLWFAGFVVAAALAVAAAIVLPPAAEPHPAARGGRHLAWYGAAGPARTGPAARVELELADRAATGGPADAAPTSAADGWSEARAVLTARLEAVEQAAARRAAFRRSHPGTDRLCRRYQHVAASGARGASLVVRNDSYGGAGLCLTNVNRWANFAVLWSTARHAGPEPVAFPNIFYGCSWGVCSPGTSLPRRLSRLGNPVTSWYTAGNPAGRWDVAYDIWFARKRRTSGQDLGAEIMLWLRTRGLGRPAAADSLVIDRRRWHLEYWITTNPATGDRWPLIIFQMIHPRGYVRHLALMPFFRQAENLGLLHRSWWLTAIEAGFEVWRGGAGLRTTSFWIRP